MFVDINDGNVKANSELLYRHNIFKNKIKLFKIIIVYLIFGIEYAIEVLNTELYTKSLSVYKKIFWSIMILAENERPN